MPTHHHGAGRRRATRTSPTRPPTTATRPTGRDSTPPTIRTTPAGPRSAIQPTWPRWPPAPAATSSATAPATAQPPATRRQRCPAGVTAVSAACAGSAITANGWIEQGCRDEGRVGDPPPAAAGAQRQVEGQHGEHRDEGGDRVGTRQDREAGGEGRHGDDQTGDRPADRAGQPATEHRDGGHERDRRDDRGRPQGDGAVTDQPDPALHEQQVGKQDAVGVLGGPPQLAQRERRQLGGRHLVAEHRGPPGREHHGTGGRGRRCARDERADPPGGCGPCGVHRPGPVQRALRMSSTRSLASPKSIWVFSLKNSGFCTPA